MRAAAERSPSVPPQVWDVKGMQDAYSFVKQKSKWVSPNMSYVSLCFSLLSPLMFIPPDLYISY